MIEMRNIRVTYRLRGHLVVALDNVNLEIAAGDYVAIVGPSGCGKSTLLQVLGGMLTPLQGSVRLDGESLFDLSEKSRANLRQRKIGFVFQHFNLIPYLTARENVQVPLLLGRKNQSEAEARATELLGRVGLGDRLDHKPAELSVGQQQRVALARMLANEPQIILADEPTGALDPEMSRVVLDFFDELVLDGRTVVMVTHDQAAAQRAGRCVHLREGRIDQTIEHHSERVSKTHPVLQPMGQ